MKLKMRDATGFQRGNLRVAQRHGRDTATGHAPREGVTRLLALVYLKQHAMLEGDSQGQRDERGRLTGLGDKTDFDPHHAQRGDVMILSSISTYSARAPSKLYPNAPLEVAVRNQR